MFFQLPNYLKLNLKILNYLEWFKETFKIDQTNLVKTLCRSHPSTFETKNCYDYYVSKFDIYLSTEEEKRALIKKHENLIIREKELLLELFQDGNQPSLENLNDNVLKEFKESLQEIEVQKEIIKKINTNIHSHFEGCHWYPFQDQNLFFIFSKLKLPILILEKNYWIGIVPDHYDCVTQQTFFKLLEEIDLPENPTLVVTKLTTWIKYDFQNSPTAEFLELDRTIHSETFEEQFADYRLNTRKISRQMVINNWETIYRPIHAREE